MYSTSNSFKILHHQNNRHQFNDLMCYNKPFSVCVWFYGAPKHIQMIFLYWRGFVLNGSHQTLSIWLQDPQWIILINAASDLKESSKGLTNKRNLSFPSKSPTDMEVTQTSCFPFSPPGYNPEKWISKPHRHIGLLKQSTFYSQLPAACQVCTEEFGLHRITKSCYKGCPSPSPSGLCVWCADSPLRVFEAWQMTLDLSCLEAQWIRSSCLWNEQPFISLMSRSVSYRLTHRRLAAW